ncbi:MAG: hypothetical protein KDD64_11305 [Bdellovibrionales bacterium]|nr:hypothetical protein [Bdellovibrionales bacterium]
MAVSIGSNIASLQAQRRLSNSSDTLGKVFERLASGQRINRASDDAAGLAVADGLNLKARVFGQSLRNLNEGISALSIADQAISNLSLIVDRQRELAFQSSNGVFSDTQRISLDTEAQELAAEYQRILESTKYNGLNLLDGSLSGIDLQAGFGTNAILSSDILGSNATTQQVAVQNVLTQDFSSFSGVANVTNFQFYVTDFNSDGIDDLFFLGRSSLIGASQVDYAMGIMLGDESGTYSLSGPMRSGSIDPGALGGNDLSDFQVTVDTMSDTITVGAINLGSDILRFVYDYDANGVIEATPSSFTLGLNIGNTTVNPSGDFNDDGRNDTIVKNLASDLFTVQTTVDDEQTIHAGGVLSLLQSVFSLQTVSDAKDAIDSLESLATTLSNARARIGSSQSRIETAQNVLDASAENFRQAEGRIRDADIADESSSLIREQTLQQTSAAILAQANLQPALALDLLRNI